MKRFLRIHEEWFLASIGVLLFALIVGYAAWTVVGVSAPVGRAMTVPSGNEGKIEFRIDELKSLNIRGLNVGQ